MAQAQTIQPSVYTFNQFKLFLIIEFEIKPSHLCCISISGVMCCNLSRMGSLSAVRLAWLTGLLSIDSLSVSTVCVLSVDLHTAHMLCPSDVNDNTATPTKAKPCHDKYKIFACSLYDYRFLRHEHIRLVWTFMGGEETPSIDDASRAGINAGRSRASTT